MSTAFIEPPKRIAFLLRPAIWIAEKITGRSMLPARLLAHHWQSALGAGVLEALTPHGKNPAELRLLKLVRLKASLATACPFCLDMNARELETAALTQAELDGLSVSGGEGRVPSFTSAERLAIRYAEAISQTPLSVPGALVTQLQQHYSDKDIVRLAATVAQVNYWARLIQALGIPPAGFSADCPLQLPTHGGAG